MDKSPDVLAVVGGQYGSEGKGVIVHKIAHRYGVHVRVGGPNAGHSFVEKGRLWKMQMVPCGWVNPDAVLVIGRGCLIDMKQLKKEIEEIEKVDPTIRSRVRVDALAGIVSPSHAKEAGGVEGELHKRYGSTGKGTGVARMARLARDPDNFQFFREVADDYGLADLAQEDTPMFLGHVARSGAGVLLEGTQGFGLSLLHGPWPFCTNHDTTAAQLAADCGLSPRLVNRVMVVARTFPIRVHGNSGPLANERTWEEISQRVGKPVEERTTVTNLVRRVGEWDEQLFLRACEVNAPTSLAITFMDYLAPEVEGAESWDGLSERAVKFVDYLEAITGGVPVAFVGTGGDGFKVINREFRP